MKIFWYLIAAIRGILIVLSMILALLFYALSRIVFKHTKASGLRLRQNWITYVAYPILNLKVKVKGAPIDRPALYVSNHRSFTDPIAVSKYLNAFVIAKAEVASYPVINKGAEVTGVLYVQRTDKNSRTETRKAFVDVIKQGHNILVYPEGTISITPEPLEFKKGTFYSAAKEDITVVPVAIEFRNEKDIWTISNFMGQYFNQFSKWKTEVKLSFGPALTSKDGEDLYNKAFGWVKEELSQMQEGWINVDWEAVRAAKRY